MKHSIFQIVSLILLFIYLVLLLKLVVFKGGLSELTEHFTSANGSPVKPLDHNLVPFRTIYYYVSMKEPLDVAVRNLAGNIILFIPYGILLPMAFSGIRSWKRLLLTVILTSLVFETLQALTDLGSFDVDDILLNLAGGISGWLIFLAIVRPGKVR